MAVLTTAALPMFVENITDCLPVSSGRTIRQWLLSHPDLVHEGLLTAIRQAFKETGQARGAPTDTDRRAFLLRCLTAVVDPFDVPAATEEVNEAWFQPDYLAMLEACALYGIHLMRDLFDRFSETSGAQSDEDAAINKLNGRLLTDAGVSERIKMVYQLTHVEALERLLDAAWKERSGARYKYRSTVVLENGEARWTVDRDAFIAGPHGLTWIRNGVIWFGQGHVCGGQPIIQYEDKAALRLNKSNIESTRDLWRAGPTLAVDNGAAAATT